MLAFIAAFAAFAPVEIKIEAQARPAAPYAEIAGGGIDVDGDILVRNRSDVDLALAEIEMSSFDSEGRLLQRKLLNENGTSPSIDLVTDRKLPAHGALLIFNPFPHFASDARPSSLVFRMQFDSADGEKHATASVEVQPKPEAERRFHFPLQGRTLIWDGHDFASHHRRWNYLHPVLQSAGFNSTAARNSFDMILIDEQGRPSAGDEAVNSSWLSFGKPVLAVADGTVADVRSDQPDDRNFDPATAPIPNAMYGNYVVVAHSDGSYSMYGHLMQSSATVHKGDKVTAGQQIARVGASGSALFPHLHFQRMDGPNDRSEGVPTRFGGVKRPNGQEPRNGFVDSGDVIVAQ